LISGGFSTSFDRVFVVDTRYAYEFAGGHIRTAINMNEPEQLESYFFEKVFPQAAIVFHCEFSEIRGPSFAEFFRELDRSINVHPALHYPYVYILDGGYSKFYRRFPDSCDGSHTRMFDRDASDSGALATANGRFQELMTSANTKLKGQQTNENTPQSTVKHMSVQITRRRRQSDLGH
jgi:M-phase inducer tyrosine phosphatase